MQTKSNLNIPRRCSVCTSLPSGKKYVHFLPLADWLTGWQNEMLWERPHQAPPGQLSALPVTASHCLETKMRQTESVRCSQCSQCSQGFNHRQQEEEYWRGQQTGAARCHAIFRNSAVPALHQNFYQQISAEGERGKCYIAGAASNENFNPIEIKKK